MELREKCAVFGAYTKSKDAAYLTYLGLSALQHRGQESSGISVSDGKRLLTHKGPGLVSEIYNEESLSIMTGTHAIGHNRYSTSGGTSANHIQPVIVYQNQIAVAHNGNIPVTRKLEEFLKGHNFNYSKLNDSGMIAESIGILKRMGKTTEEAIQEVFPLLHGTFALVVLDNDGITAVRDAYGNKPLCMGKLDYDGYIIASETCALDAVGATFVKEILPGEMVRIDEDGVNFTQIEKPNQKLDIIEFVYFARNDSVISGRSVYEVRKNLGKNLAKEMKGLIDADIVIPIPESSIPAAVGFSNEYGLPLEYGLQRNRYIQRTFIMPNQDNRERSLKQKLNAIPEVVAGKKVVLVDDSIVRGTTSRKIVDVVKAAGAKEVHMLISSAPIIYPDFYGIDIPSQKELIAANMSVEEIRNYIHADTLHYLSYDGMIEATKLDEDQLCTACFNGNYPIDVSEVFKKTEEKKPEDLLIAEPALI